MEKEIGRIVTCDGCGKPVNTNEAITFIEPLNGSVVRYFVHNQTGGHFSQCLVNCLVGIGRRTYEAMRDEEVFVDAMQG